MPLIPSNVSRRRHSGGFSLVEVMIALVVLGVGLLGIAKLVMSSSHANDSAYLRSQATALGYTVLDNMRANLNGAAAGNYTVAFNPAFTAPSPATCNGSGGSCTNAQMAAADIYAWQRLLQALPSGVGSITTSAGFPLKVTVVVQWDDSAAESVFNGAKVAIGTLAPTQITLQSVIE